MPDSPAQDQVKVTEGLDLLWELAAQPDNIAFRTPDAQLENMQYLHGSFRWPAVYGANGSATVTVPRAGTYYFGAVVYEGFKALTLYGMPKVEVQPGTPTYEMWIDDRMVGRFSPRYMDGGERLYFLDEPLEFKGGERLKIRTGAAGPYVLEDILLTRLRPPIREKEYAIRHAEASPVWHEGKQAVRVTWITSWPAQCTVEWGRAPRYAKTIQETQALANHRIYITGLEPDDIYHCRIVAPRPDGSEVTSGDIPFTVSGAAPLAAGTPSGWVALKVENGFDFRATGAPVTSGVPFARGELIDAKHLRLLASDGSGVPFQTDVAGRWPDGSVKWAVLTFAANAEAGAAPVYRLEFGHKVRPLAPTASSLSATRAGHRITVKTGPLVVEFDASQSGFPVAVALNAKPMLAHPVEARVMDAQGRGYSSAGSAESIEVEESGPVRVVVRSRGHHHAGGSEGSGGSGGSAGGGDQAFFAYDARFMFYADSPLIRVEYAWGNDRDELFTHFKSIAVRVPLAGAEPVRWATGVDGGGQAGGQGEVAMRQLRPDTLEVTPGTAGGAPHRGDGWLDARSEAAGITLGIRDFWQLYPRSLAVKNGTLEAGVTASFPEGYYDGASDKDLVNLYYHIRGKDYKIRQGVKKSHELMLLFHTDEPGTAAHVQKARLFQEPLVAVCEPSRYCDTGVFGLVLPAGTGGGPGGLRYEELCEGTYRDLVSRRDSEAWYGQLNYGDMLGENLVSWLNNEYDNGHSYFLQFARTGDRRWYFLGETAARHMTDVDICHYGPQAGAEWAHTIGHTGGYYDEDPYKIPRFDNRGSGNLWESVHAVCHAWAGAVCDWHYLSGDRRALEALRAVADYSSSADYLNNFEWFATREAGWQMTLVLTAYRATNDAFYLNAARIILRAVLERQTPGPRGWHHQMVPAHCYCTPRHRGEASYMLGVLATGLETYHEITGDPDTSRAIIGAADQVIDEMWNDELGVFRPTSCPKNAWTTPELMKEKAPLFLSNAAQMLLFAYRQTGREKYLDVARRAMAKTLGARNLYHQHMYWVPRVLWYMDATGQVLAPDVEPAAQAVSR